MSLVTQGNIEARLGRSLTADEATDFVIINSAVQSYYERMLNTSVESVGLTTRYYDGGIQNLEIDPCTDISSVSYRDVDSDITSTLLSTEYTTEPINRTLKTMIRSRYGKFTSGMNVIGVEAKFSTYGDSDVSDIVKNAIMDAIVQILNGRESINKESIEGYSVEYSKLKETTAMLSVKTIIQGII